MGTPEFAVPSLQALHESRHDIVLVVTQPDRPRGRGRKITPSPVKESAIRYGYDLSQPESVKSHAFREVVAGFKPDLLVVVAFGSVLPGHLLELPPLKAINVHASLLPKYRGPAPIQWAIINGEKETGVTTMLMDEGLDTGDILLQQTIPISPEDTALTLHDKLAWEGACLLLETLENLTTGMLIPTAQDPNRASYVPMLQKKDGHINWERPAKDIANFIRGINPWPGAFTFCGDTRLKIFKSRCLDKDTLAAPGTVLMSFPDEMLVATGKGTLLIEELQSASGKCLSTKEYLCGCSMEAGTVLT